MPTLRLFDCSLLTNAHKPIKHSKTQVSPPNLVLAGAATRQIANTANASEGKGRCNKGICLFFMI